MSELVSLEKASELLGVTADQLNDLRLKNEIFGTRVDNAWKFKMDEIQRYADDRNISLSGDGNGSDFKLSDESLELSFGSSDGLLEDSVGDEELDFAGSEVGESDVLADDQPEGGASASDTGKLVSGSGELQLSDDLFDDDISLQDSSSLVDSSDLSADFEDSDLVLEDSDSSEDPAFAAGGSGISLSANESGISLEGDIDDLELPEDEDVISLDDASSLDSGALLQSDDNFDLTPLEDSGFEDSSSGSQVIALEDSAIYTDDSAPTMLGAEDSVDFDAGPAVEESVFQTEPDVTIAGAPSVPETPYTLLNVLALALCLIVVSLGCIVAFDLARNMWQPADSTLSSTITNSFIKLAGYESQ